MNEWMKISLFVFPDQLSAEIPQLGFHISSLSWFTKCGEIWRNGWLGQSDTTGVWSRILSDSFTECTAFSEQRLGYSLTDWTVSLHWFIQVIQLTEKNPAGLGGEPSRQPGSGIPGHSLQAQWRIFWDRPLASISAMPPCFCIILLAFTSSADAWTRMSDAHLWKVPVSSAWGFHFRRIEIRQCHHTYSWNTLNLFYINAVLMTAVSHHMPTLGMFVKYFFSKSPTSLLAFRPRWKMWLNLQWHP